MPTSSRCRRLIAVGDGSPVPLSRVIAVGDDAHIVPLSRINFRRGRVSRPLHAQMGKGVFPKPLFGRAAKTARKSKKQQTGQACLLLFGMPDAIRTHGLQSRSLTLYPAELRAHMHGCCRKKYSITFLRRCREKKRPVSRVTKRFSAFQISRQWV